MSDTDRSFADPGTWLLVEWALCGLFGGFVSLVVAIDDDFKSSRWTPGHWVTIGVVIVEVGLVWHFVHYPSTFIVPAQVLAYGVYDAVMALWAAIPTVHWKPWWVTSGLTVVGLVPLAGGLLPTFRSGGGER